MADKDLTIVARFACRHAADFRKSHGGPAGFIAKFAELRRAQPSLKASDIIGEQAAADNDPDAGDDPETIVAAMSRDDLLSNLADLGQDVSALGDYSDDDLREMLRQLLQPQGQDADQQLDQDAATMAGKMPAKFREQFLHSFSETKKKLGKAAARSILAR